MTKKILLFLVEGQSDKNALESILSELFDSLKIRFKVLRCDLTTDITDMKNDTLKKRITNVIRDFLCKVIMSM